MTETGNRAMTGAKNAIVVYQPNATIRLETLYSNESIWLTQLKIAELFGVQKAAVSKHLKNIFATGELDRAATVSKMETVRPEGTRTVARVQEFFNLDAIIAVGYRVNSLRATQFRIWATGVLRDYLLRGYAFNQRLAHLEDKVDRRLADHDRKIAGLEDKVDFFVQTSLPPVRGVFYDGQVFDAKAFAARHVWSARKSILLIDNWVDVATLELLSKKAKGVSVEIVTSRTLPRRHRRVQQAIRRPLRPRVRELPRPLPRHRRQNPLRHRRLPEGHGPQMLRVHETGLRGNRATEGEDMTP
jgi:hypothetical protein